MGASLGIPCVYIDAKDWGQRTEPDGEEDSPQLIEEVSGDRPRYSDSTLVVGQ